MRGRLVIGFFFALLMAAAVGATVADSLVITTPTANAPMGGNYTISFSFNGTANITIRFHNTTDWIEINASNGTTGAPYTYIFDTSAHADAYQVYNISINVTNSTDAADTNQTQIDGLTIDNTPPTVASAVLGDPSPTKAGNVTVNVTFTEITSGLDYAVDPTVTFTLPNTSVLTLTNLSYAAGSWIGWYDMSTETDDGTVTIGIVGATDLAANTMDADTSNTFTFDSTPPTVTIVNSSFNTTDATPDITFNFTDALSLTASCTLLFNGTGYDLNATTSNSTNTVMTANSTLSAGSYAVGVNCTDLAGNANGSATITVTVDTTAPVITSVSSGTPTSSAATITWTTDEPANTSVNYGTTTALGTLAGSSSLATSHSVALTGLTASTTYYYNVSSCDSAGNCNTTVAQGTFTTAAAGGSGGGGYSPSGLSTAGSRVTLTSFGSYSFVVGTQSHMARVKEIGSDFVIVRFSSDPVDVTLKQGEGKNVDLTGDGKMDTYVELISFSQTSAQLLIGLARTAETPPAEEPVEQPAETPPAETPPPNAPVVPEQQVEEPAPAPEEQPAAEPPSGGHPGLWIALIVVVVLCLFVWWGIRTKWIKWV